MLSTPEFWVGVSFVVFVALLLYYKVPAMVTKALDKRADEIRRELDEARKLKEEAQEILSDYQRRQQEAETEAEAIVVQAKREAEALKVETMKSLDESLARRVRMTEEKIARAEQQAVADVRNAAANVAVAAAEALIRKKLSGSAADSLVANSIAEVKSKLN